MRKQVIHILGASGSGTTTMGAAIAENFGYTHLDADDYFWLPTAIPFTEKRDVTERQRLMAQDIDKLEGCIVSGSMCGWGDVFIPMFTLIILVETPADIRLDRLERRESERFGQRIQSGGDMYQDHKDFIEWAGAYDTGALDMRSKALHMAWLENVTCPVLTMDGTKALRDNLAVVEGWLRQK